MSQKDYYTVIGVPEDADQGVIKKAYRDLAKRYHPDRNSGNAEAEKRFKEVQEAYDVLGDPGKRKKYDDLRKFGAGGGNFDLNDLFGGGGGSGGGGFGGSIFDIFERAGMGRRRTPAARRGDDLRSEITIDFETAAFGGTSTIRVPREEPCAPCSGTGTAPGSKPEVCPVCAGTGTSSTAQGGFAFSRPCPRCYGQGRVIKDPCKACSGRGNRRLSREIDVRIPAGIADGGKIRLKGEGEAGDRGAPTGDLILTVRVRGHASFKRDGLDVESEIKISIATAALGTSVEVQTLQGPVELKVPGGVQPNARLRLKGRGVQDHRGRAGDHFVRVKVEVPRQLTERQRRLLQEFVEADETGKGAE